MIASEPLFVPPKIGQTVDSILLVPAIVVFDTEEIDDYAAVIGEEIAAAMSGVEMGGRGCFEGSDPVHPTKK